MAIKTISLELDAYEKLRRAKRPPRESFSSVVRRARWEDQPPDARSLLEGLRVLVKEHPEVLLAPDTLRAIERRKRTARPKSRWER
ncbi:MAG: antitoxin VapB family protein [Acidobacteriota bacterium]